MHVKKTGDWSDKYKKLHNDRLSIHREYSAIEHVDIEEGEDAAADDKMPTDSEKIFLDNFQDKHHQDKDHGRK